MSVLRLEPHADAGCQKLYIMTLAVLPEYRRKGIGKSSVQFENTYIVTINYSFSALFYSFTTAGSCP